jgi:DNA ligase-1
MDYREIVKTYELLEATTKRLELTSILVDLLKRVKCDEMERVLYLTRGKLGPDYIGLEIGLGEKLIIKAIGESVGLSEKSVQEEYRRLGDLGSVAEFLFERRTQRTLFSEPLTVERVFENLVKIAQKAGSGAQREKLNLLEELLNDCSRAEAKYIIRTLTGKARLGIADMTILDALAIAFAGGDREGVERAYNLCPDIGKIAKKLCIEGRDGIAGVKIEIGIPIRAMLAERLSTPEEILEKMGGECAVEYKYDGLRIQAHVERGKVKLFSRRLEDLTSQFPDVVEGLLESFRGKKGVIEGECVVMNPHTGEMLPFQQISHRRGRKYALEDAIEEYPITLFLFDCLYDGEDLTMESYQERRKKLDGVVRERDKVKISTSKIVDDVDKLERFFEGAIEAGCEGLMAKSLSSPYRAGARGWQWIKYKREYRAELVDTVDLVVVGAFAGRGRRKGWYGALLMACYNDEMDTFESVCKLGTGFTDEMLKGLPKRLDGFRRDTKDPRVESELEPDYWFSPSIVLEVLGGEITLSPIHMAGYGVLKKGSGFAIRFPRFTGRWRDDKKPEDATTTKELIDMYKAQLKRIEG